MERVLRALPRELSTLSPAARTALQSAARAALSEDRALASCALEQAIGHDPERAVARLMAAQVRYALGQYQRALDELDVAERCGAAAHADELRYGFLARLGWTHEAGVVIERRLAAGAGRLWSLRAVQHFGRMRHESRALEHLNALLADGSDSASLALNAAHLAVRLGQHAEARRHVARALELEPRNASLRVAAAFLLADGGSIKEALEHARRAIELSPVPASHAAHAELSLWVGDLESAELHAERCLDAGGWRVRGAVATMRGDPEASLGLLERALTADPRDATAHVWRAESLLQAHRFDDSAGAADAAIAVAEGYLFPAQLIRLLATLRSEEPREDRLSAASFGELRRAAAEIVPAAAEVFEGGDRTQTIAVLERVLGRLGGNRSERTTWIDDGRVRPLVAREGVRYLSRAALDRIRLEPLAAVLAEMDAIAERYPESSLPFAHRGEANLWLGRLDEARADLERALSINTFTRWAYIGLGAVETQLGEYDRALDVLALGVERMRSTGPAVYVHRGEALRELGRLNDAIRDLELACELNPGRLSASINLALARHAQGDHESAEAIYERLCGRAPGLLSDAALAIDVESWRPADRSAQQQILASALRLMRGNRSSSCHTYVTDRGTLRTVPTGLEVPLGIDAKDADGLSSVLDWLERRSPGGTVTRVDDAHGEPHRDVEVVALLAGLRSAVRASVTAEQLEPARRRYAAAGLVSLVSPLHHEYDGEQHMIVVAARIQADAERALAAETGTDSLELGRLLGYPDCCVRAFAGRPMSFTVFEGAKSAWVERPLPRLNTLCFGLGARFISFEPCRFDCPQAAEIADKIADAVAAKSPDSARWCDSELAHAIAFAADDARARVELDARGRISAAHAIPSVAERPVSAESSALAERLLGASVGSGGRIEVRLPHEVLLFDFGWQSRRT